MGASLLCRAAAVAALAACAAQALADGKAASVRGIAPGRWASNDNVATTGSKTGAKFFLDIAVSADGSFKGTWEQYVCFNYPGAYGIVTVACQRSRKPAAASGRLDSAAGAGTIDLQGLGKSSLRFRRAASPKGQPQLDLELPREWLKQGEPVLYEASLNPKGG